MKRLLAYISANWNSYRATRCEKRLRTSIEALNKTISERDIEVQSLQQRVRELDSEVAIKQKENELLANAFRTAGVYVDTLIQQHGFRVGERDGS